MRCEESLRLTRLLTGGERWSSPDVEALRALFCFHIARAPARCAEDGSLVLLHEQDRSRLDQALLAEGLVFLARSARGEEISRFHLEAGIAACHAQATSYAATDWEKIVSLYDALREMSPSPVIEVNRALAVAMCRGAVAGLDELDTIPERELIRMRSQRTPSCTHRSATSTRRAARSLSTRARIRRSSALTSGRVARARCSACRPAS